MSGTEGSGASRAADLFNEDAFLVSDELGLYVVCDGASGGPAGEVAADIAIEALAEFVRQAEAEHGPVLTQPPLSLSFADRAVRHAVEAVLAAADADPELRGMSTTLSMLLVLAGRGVVGHTGDSRVYRIRRRKLTKLTIDHDESERLGSASVTGNRSSDLPDPVVDSFAVDLEVDDVFLLCTDGAEAVLDDPDLPRHALDVSPRMLASRIASSAHRARRDVDATVVVVHVGEVRDASSLALSGRPAQAAFGHSLAVGARRPTDDVADDEIDSDDLRDASESTSATRAGQHTRRRLAAPDDLAERSDSAASLRKPSSR